MSPQIAGLAPATRVASRKLGPTSGRCSASSLSAVAACVDQDVGDHVRKMADRRHQAVMRLGLDRLRARAEVGDRALDAVVEHPARRGRRRQVPAGALEEVRSGVLDARGLRSGEGMPADEAAVRAEGGDHVALHRADVGDRAVLGPLRPAPPRRGREAPSPGRRRRPAPPPRPPAATASCAESIAPSSSGPLEQLPVGVEPGHLGVEPGAGGEPDRPTDQTRRRGRRSSSLRLRAAYARQSASRSSVSTVVSQSMQASVIDWP